MRFEQLPHAFVSVKRLDFGENLPAQQYRMARLASIRDANDGRLANPVSFNDRGQGRRLDSRLISKDEHCGFCTRADLLQARPDGGTATFVKPRRLHNASPLEGDLIPDRRRFMADD